MERSRPPRVARSPLLAALLTVAALACYASANPEATASYVVPVPRGTTTYAQLDAGLRSARPGMFVTPKPGDRCQYDLIMDFLEKPRTWGKVVLPKDIQGAVGDARVYIMTGGGNLRSMWGVREDRYYRLPVEVNQFAVDCGLLWSPDNVAELFRVYTFFLAAYERMRIDNSFVHDRFTEISPALVDSLVNGIVPLVPAFTVGSVKPRLGTDRGSTRPGTVSSLSAAVEWEDRTEGASVVFTGVVGFPANTFPEIWKWEGREPPWGIKLNLAHPPERRDN